jgi:hypothetical protein
VLLRGHRDLLLVADGGQHGSGLVGSLSGLDALDVDTSDMSSALPVDVVAHLDGEPVKPIVEYLAGRLGCDRGTWTIELCVRDGWLLKRYRHHGPVPGQELERVARAGAPPLG